MTDLRTRIREALRDEEDERLSADEAAAIRRVIVASVRADDKRRAWSFQPLAVAATLVAMIGVGIAVGQRFERRDVHFALANTIDGNHVAGDHPDGARQLHFATPGGTRIIWIFNSNLDLRTAP